VSLPIAVIAGVGARRGLGAALARRAAAEGLRVVAAGRTRQHVEEVVDEIAAAGGLATPWDGDLTREDEVEALFQGLGQAGSGPLELVVHNLGANTLRPFHELTATDFEVAWRVNCLSGFLVARATLAQMAPPAPAEASAGTAGAPLPPPTQRRTLIFTGATASLRARPPFTAFACAKAGLRALAQGLAREFGPQGVHVAHVVIDGVIDGERARQIAPGLVAARGAAGLLCPEEIAEAYWALHQQRSSAWTHELDLRPYREPF